MNRIAFIAAILAIVPTVASAEPNSVTITVSRADFATPVAQAKLQHRIAAGIEQVCGSFATIESSQEPAVAECWAAAKISVAQRLASLGNRTTIELAAK